MQRFGLRNCFRVALLIILGVGAAREKIYAAKGPCDIYAAGGTPCVGAYSTVRALYSSYSGPLYQVKRQSDNQTKDIGVLTPGGVANAAAQDSFLTATTGIIAKIYDQSPNGNDLPVSPPVLHLPNGGTGTNATAAKIVLGGHTVYGVHVLPDGGGGGGNSYRNDKTQGVATGDQAEAMYMVVDGKYYNNRCCFDFGNVETSGNDDGTGTMETINWGNVPNWSQGTGNGPWVLADLENGVYAGSQSTGTVQSNTPVTANYVTTMLKGPSGNHFTLKGGDAQSGSLGTKWDGARPSGGYSPMRKEGGIELGTGGDGSSGGDGTFFEGAIVSGNPPDSIDDSVQTNIVAAGYGSNTTPTLNDAGHPKAKSIFTVNYALSNGGMVIGYALQSAGRVRMSIVDVQGREIAEIVNGIMPAGTHAAVWNAKRASAGVYLCRASIDGHESGEEKIIKGN